jgi:nitrogen fixation NifU-like protein
MNDAKENKFDFWNDHSLEFLEMAMRRDYQETLVVFDGYGVQQRDCGDTIEIFICIEDDRIQGISYDIKGCLYSHACANALIELAGGVSIRAAGTIQADQILGYLKTLPAHEAHCADHVLAAFRLALADCQSKK